MSTRKFYSFGYTLGVSSVAYMSASHCTVLHNASHTSQCVSDRQERNAVDTHACRQITVTAVTAADTSLFTVHTRASTTLPLIDATNHYCY
jgi:hypothetical protein